jgi:hypothetical protein
MSVLLLADIERAVRQSWSPDTCPPESRARWNPDNPSWGQCGVTAMVLNDLLGGELIRGEVIEAGGGFHDYHWWNRLGTGVEIDLTREQFQQGEVIRDGVPVARTPAHTWKRLRPEYELLRKQVYDRLHLSH